MLHHVEIYVSRIEASRTFWTNILAKIGWKLSVDWRDGFTLIHGEDAYLTFVQAANKYKSNAYHRCGVGLNHLAFQVKTRKEVDAIRQYCFDNNIPNLYDDKYPFATGSDDYYALFVEDPDRIKVEFVASA